MTTTQPQSFAAGSWEVASDLLIATALLWAPPLVLGGAAALIALLVRAL